MLGRRWDDVAATSFTNGSRGHCVVNNLDTVREKDQIEQKLQKLGPFWMLEKFKDHFDKTDENRDQNKH